MVVKENHLRLTLASLDHRLGRLDDVADSLLQAVALMQARRPSTDSLDVCFLCNDIDIHSFSYIPRVKKVIFK